MKRYILVILFAFLCLSGNPLLSQIRKSLYVQSPCLMTVVQAKELQDSGFELYPNPNDGSFRIKFLNRLPKNEISITVFNEYGSAVLFKKLSVVDDFCSLNLEKPASGIYLIRISAGNITHSKKFIVSN